MFSCFAVALQLESLFQLTNELIISWKLLIVNHLEPLYLRSNVHVSYMPTYNVGSWARWLPPPPSIITLQIASK